MVRGNLHIVTAADAKGAPTVEDELRALLRARSRARLQVSLIEAQMQPLRRRFADDRGETMLPTLERLTRELKP